MEMASPLGRRVGDGVNVCVLAGMVVDTIAVAMNGVDVATPITTGVGVKMNGVGVAGRKGVGPGNGWIIQPPQDVNRSVSRIGRKSLFIFSPLCHCIPV
jgi:hypothetical protein